MNEQTNMPTGRRYVRYGTMSRGKFHIMLAEPPKGITQSGDYDALCGVGLDGASPCTATSDVLAGVGWLNAAHVCKRCISGLS